MPLSVALLLAAAILVGLALPQRAVAQQLSYFYCYAPDPQSKTNYVSDVHPVGDLHERANYGKRFEDFLRIRGKLGLDTQAYCVMRATMREINAGRMGLRNQPCRECAGVEKIEDIVWPRPGGTRVPSMRVGTGTRPTPTTTAETEAPAREEKREPENIGAYVMGREDEIDVAAAMNESDAAAQVKSKTASTGGKWRTLLSDDRCAGWIAVAFVSDGKAHDYFVARGAASESEASAAALELADRFGQVEADKKGVVFTGHNKVEREPLSLDEHVTVLKRGPMGAAQFWVRRILVSGCSTPGTMSGIGARG